MALEKGVKLGSFADSPETYKFLVDNCFEYIAYSVDINLFINGLKKIKSDLCR